MYTRDYSIKEITKVLDLITDEQMAEAIRKFSYNASIEENTIIDDIQFYNKDNGDLNAQYYGKETIAEMFAIYLMNEFVYELAEYSNDENEDIAFIINDYYDRKHEKLTQEMAEFIVKARIIPYRYRLDKDDRNGKFYYYKAF